ncbi:histidine phosphatase family protein [Longimicrobium sp.]|jgi:probable phosphoglycerate mutase|uniref:histidine phosphatase family protein n=1 Tax=Longimicrobium sp. TaxID=2029185 RepID=UPI002F9560CB
MGNAGRLYLARHGVTAANLRWVNVGIDAEPLLPAGREMARELAERVREEGIEEVWCSPIARARETAEIVAEACGLPLYEDAALREMDVGPWAGLTDDEISERFPEEFARWQADPAAFVMDGRETLPAVRQRVVAALERMRQRGRVSLAVTHTAPIRLARVHYAGEETNQFAEFMPANCQLLRLVEREGGARLEPVADPSPAGVSG